MNATNVKICTDKPTVNKIIEAAVPLFATRGLAAVSVKELADAAGVNIALISYYFGGKDNLYAFILEQELAVLGDAIEKISKEEISPLMKIREFAGVVLDTYKKRPYLDRLFFVEIFNPTKYFDSFVKTAVYRLHYFLKDCVQAAIACGEFRADIDPGFAAMSFMKILNLSFTTQQFCRELLPNRENIAEQYMLQALEIYLYGVTMPVSNKETGGKK